MFRALANVNLFDCLNLIVYDNFLVNALPDNINRNPGLYLYINI
ncbi:hypothetical protein NIES3585_04370 [Nodularia sp. NIES-3585]|nr:hypothetical protein NIES3585_04370 [Nodularia sp. NIES-3585]